MNSKKLIKHLEKYGCVLAKNIRPLRSILAMDSFLRVEQERYTLLGYVFGRPIFIKVKKKYENTKKS